MTKLFSALAVVFTALVALLHTGFMILEMFFWNHPTGQRIFSMTPEAAESSAVLAANQGLYNGFLVAGLLWGLISKKRDVTLFFLLCVVVAGVFGAFTAKPTIFFIQAMPAILAIGFMMLSNKKA